MALHPPMSCSSTTGNWTHSLSLKCHHGLLRCSCTNGSTTQVRLAVLAPTTWCCLRGTWTMAPQTYRGCPEAPSLILATHSSICMVIMAQFSRVSWGQLPTAPSLGQREATGLLLRGLLARRQMLWSARDHTTVSSISAQFS